MRKYNSTARPDIQSADTVNRLSAVVSVRVFVARSAAIAAAAAVVRRQAA